MGNQNKMFTLKNHFLVLILIIITHVMNSKKYFSRENTIRASAMSQQDYDEKHHHLTNAQKKEIKEGRFNKDYLVELFDDDWSAFNTNKMITVPGKINKFFDKKNFKYFNNLYFYLIFFQAIINLEKYSKSKCH